MGRATDLDIALDRRRREGIEQPARVLVGDHAVPFATNDRDRRLNERRIVGELAMPGMDDVVKRPGRDLHADRIVPAAVRIAVEVALAPSVEMRARKHRRLLRRYVLRKARPLRLERHDLPGRRAWRLFVAPRRPPRHRTEQHETVDERRMRAGKARGGNAAPRMRDDRNSRHQLLVEDEAHRRGDWIRGLRSTAERRILRRRLIHLGIAIGRAEAVAVECPDIEARSAQHVAPRLAVEPMRDRQRRWKRAAVYVEHDAILRGGLYRRQAAEKELQVGTRTRNPEVFLAWIELR